jgi:hypothetical protein
MTLIWFIVWMVNGHPWLLSEWNSGSVRTPVSVEVLEPCRP